MDFKTLRIICGVLAVVLLTLIILRRRSRGQHYLSPSPKDCDNTSSVILSKLLSANITSAFAWQEFGFVPPG